MAGGVANALLRDTNEHADVAVLRLHHCGVSGDLDELGARRGQKEILLREVADLNAGVAMLPLEVVGVNVGLIVEVTALRGVPPGAVRRSHTVGIGWRRTYLELRDARLRQWLAVALAGRIVDAVEVPAETNLPSVADAAVHTEGRLRAGSVRRAIGHPREGHHLPPEARRPVHGRSQGCRRSHRNRRLRQH